MSPNVLEWQMGLRPVRPLLPCMVHPEAILPSDSGLALAFYWVRREFRVSPNFPGEPLWAGPKLPRHPQGSHGSLFWASRPFLFQKMVKYSPKLLLLNLLSFTCKENMIFLQKNSEEKKLELQIQNKCWRRKTDGGGGGSREQFP